MLRIAIIGCGLIGNKRAAALPSGSVVSVYDMDSTKAQALAKSMNAAVAASVDEAIAGADAVIVATIHSSLTSLAAKAVAAGKHVLIEKPAGIHAAEIAALRDAAKQRGVVVKVGYNHRFHPAMWKAKELVDGGAVGKLLYIRGRYGHGGRIGYDKEWRAKKALAGGGEMIDQGSHLIDLSRWFLGDLDHKFSYVPTYFWDMEVEDNAFVALGGKDGTMAWLHASWTEWKNLFCFEIFGLTGKIMIDGLGGSYGVEKLTYYRMSEQMGPPAVEQFEYPGPDGSWVLDTMEFINAIAEKRAPLGNLDDALAIMNILEVAYDHHT